MKQKNIALVLALGVMSALGACNKPDSSQMARNNLLPPPGFNGVAARGEVLFNQYCSVCHGAGGLGTSDKGPPLIHKIYEPNHHGDISFYHAARNGVAAHHWQFGNMAPVTGVTSEDVAHIIAYVRREQRAAGIN